MSLTRAFRVESATYLRITFSCVETFNLWKSISTHVMTTPSCATLDEISQTTRKFRLCTQTLLCAHHCMRPFTLPKHKQWSSFEANECHNYAVYRACLNLRKGTPNHYQIDFQPECLLKTTTHTLRSSRTLVTNTLASKARKPSTQTSG